MKGKLPADIRMENQRLVLKLLRMKPHTVSEMSRLLKLSQTTILSLLDELKQNSVVHQTGMGNLLAAGRPPMLFALDPAYGVMILINLILDYKYPSFAVYLYDFCGQMLAKEPIPVIIKDCDALNAALKQAIDKMLCDTNKKSYKICNICAAVPGIIDTKTGNLVISSLQIDDGAYNIKEFLEENYRTTVKLLNSTTLFARAEYDNGYFKNSKVSLLLEVSNGIGFVLMREGYVLQGAHGFSGELGFVQENLFTGVGMPLMQRLDSGLESKIAGAVFKKEALKAAGIDEDDISFDALIRLVNTDKRAKGAIEKIALKLCSLIENLFLLFDPDTLVFSGSITELKDVFLPVFKTNMLEGFQKRTKIFFSEQEQPILDGLLEESRYLSIKIEG